ncbi:E1-E2 ATPase-domain-containing protein [Lasiosphaeris hirsuta]|uniref:E1-E2 ATPase-domain-containing protein n=1 Tax=Lasiosphaeris hirsuta TaxID=260670 RepID=A0AA40DU96_9PEZI|nr:E1-E2 ATPase-domain-containing protein [Lasiosphaeris hirsuta]
MACGSGCCGPPPDSAGAPPSNMAAGSPEPSAMQEPDAASVCCSDCSDVATSVQVHKDGTTSKESAPAACHDDGCCGQAVKPESAGHSAANDANQSHDSKKTDTCCPSESAKKLDRVATPDCCDDTTVPCCDDSCLDRLALRACEGEKEMVLITDSESTCHGVEDGRPCGHHTRVTRAAYSATLDALGCICRALLALGQESCCAPKERSSIDRKRGSRRNSARSILSRKMGVNCCGEGSCGSGSAQKPEASHGSHGSHHSHSSRASHDHHGHNAEHAVNINSSKDPCCGDCDSASPSSQLSENAPHSSPSSDPEKGFSEADWEHVVLSVTGMDCSSCENTVKRSFRPIPQVKNLQTSTTLARAEFDLDPSLGTLKDVLTRLHTTCNHTFTRIVIEDYSIDLITNNPSALAAEKEQWPKGVKRVSITSKNTVRVSYQPEKLGARDLVQGGWGGSMELAPPPVDPTIATGKKDLKRDFWMTVFSAILTVPVLVMAWAPLPEDHIAYGAASLALATIIQVVVAGPFYQKAFKALFYNRQIDMDLLIVVSTSAAYIFSVITFALLLSDQPLSVDQFFETSTLLITLIMVGRLAATFARHKAVASISVRSLQTQTAILVAEDGDKEIDTRLFQYGDRFKVAPDSIVPTDGTVINGVSEVDESMITGESLPCKKEARSPVIAGTINGSGPLIVRLNRLPADNTIAAIAKMVDKANLSKAEIQNLADKVASYFVPVIIGITLATFFIWLAVGVKVNDLSGREAATQAITYAIAALIVSCPCAIGLAVPMVIVVSTGIAADHGVVFKSAESIEVARRASHVVFDKTGTLTEGKLSIVNKTFIEEGHDPKVSTALLLGLVESIKHPVSAAVAAHLRSEGFEPLEVDKIKSLPGKGVTGVTPTNLQLKAGNSRWLHLGQDPRIQTILGSARSAFCFTIDGSLAAVFGLADTIRDDAMETVAALQGRGIQCYIFSGDDDGIVQSVASAVGIPAANIRSQCTPDMKQEHVKGLKLGASNRGPRWCFGLLPGKKSPPVVIFCGDGTNDSVAIKEATIGVAIQHDSEGGSAGIGADVAKSVADVVLVVPHLKGILTMVAVSRKAVGRIWVNFYWSFIYNIFAILLAAGAFESRNVRIPPAYAGLGELVSVVPVILLALLLKWEKF